MTIEKEVRRYSLALKLSLFVLLAVAILRLITIGLTYKSTHEIILNLVREKASYLADDTSDRLEQDLIGVEVAPTNLAANLEKIDYSRDQIDELLHDMVRTNPYVYGSTIAFEPGAFDPSKKYYAPYVHETGGTGSALENIFLEAPAYDYFQWEWYSAPKQANRAVWSEPYIDPAVHHLMATYSVPFYKYTGQNKTFRGVVTADLTMEKLVDLVGRIKLYESGHAFLISKKGTFLSHPNPNVVLHESIFSIAGRLADPKIKEIGSRMIHGERGYALLDYYFGHEKEWVFFSPIETGWSVGIVVPDKELFIELDRFTRNYLYISLVMFGILLLVIAVITRRMTLPLKSLAQRSREIAKGNLDVEVPQLRSHDEVAELSTAFENMRVSLKDYIKNLEETTAAKSRFESELKIARNIQMSFLPRTFPPFPDREEFELFAFLNPAKEVGGDLYDFFFADNDILYFLVGDVSDKGVPAALFMAATKTLMRGFASAGTQPSEVMNRVNRELHIYNETMMFVTLFCGALDLKTGKLLYSNAGHNPPVLIRSGNSEFMKPEPGFVMGVDPNFVYQSQSMMVQPGDTLIVYSDGVTEAMNAQKQIFSDERLLQLAREHATAGAAQMVQHIKDAVTAHAAGFPQSDDITVLVLEYRNHTDPNRQ